MLAPYFSLLACQKRILFGHKPNQNFDESQKITKVGGIHPLGNTNIRSWRLSRCFSWNQLSMTTEESSQDEKFLIIEGPICGCYLVAGTGSSRWSWPGCWCGRRRRTFHQHCGDRQINSPSVRSVSSKSQFHQGYSSSHALVTSIDIYRYSKKN